MLYCSNMVCSCVYACACLCRFVIHIYNIEQSVRPDDLQEPLRGFRPLHYSPGPRPTWRVGHARAGKLVVASAAA